MKKRIKRIRGTRTCGAGRTKQRRGKGSRGGVGNAGAYTHHFIRTLKKGIVKGKHGSARYYRYSPNDAEAKAVNVGELEEILKELLKTGKAEEKEDGVHFTADELGIQRLLGKGRVTNKLIINIGDTNMVSKRAQEKIEGAGGKVCIIKK